MITPQLYQEYLGFLLKGERLACGRIVQGLMDQDIEIKTLYTDLFQKSLYAVGELWEFNKVSVAKEHLVTAITEGLLNLIYPRLFEKELQKKNKKVVISCAVNEFHQIGGKMVADIFELNGWDSHFLGANTPVQHLLEYIQDVKPDLAGLSASVYFSLPSLKAGIEAIRSEFRNLDILVGGQAFHQGGKNILTQYSGVRYVGSLDELDAVISG
jgi:MerR family transcriptional regulator, light-induced transcriptional regulator